LDFSGAILMEYFFWWLQFYFFLQAIGFSENNEWIPILVIAIPVLLDILFWNNKKAFQVVSSIWKKKSILFSVAHYRDQASA
jgi:hypothetical protein